MKRHLAILAGLLIALCLSAQENDSILLERTDMLKKEITVLQKKTRSLQAQLYKIQKEHKSDMQGVKDKIASLNAGLEETKAAIADLNKALQESEESAVQGLAVMGDWTRKTIAILAVVLGILFIILLLMVITNRSRIQKEYLKLEAKVDNSREALQVELNAALKKHEEDMVALKAQIEKDKK